MEHLSNLLNIKHLLTLRFWVIFCLGMGVLLTIAAIRTHRSNAGEIPIVTSAVQFSEHYGQRVYVYAPARRTGISDGFIGDTGRNETIVWHLYIIQFDDADVALISRDGDLHFDGKFFVSVLRMPENAIAVELLQQYSPGGVGMSTYVARWAYRNVAAWTFAAAMVLLAAGSVLSMVALKRRKRCAEDVDLPSSANA